MNTALQTNTIQAIVTCADRNGNTDTRRVDTADLAKFLRQLKARGGSVEHIAVPAGTPRDVCIAAERIAECSLTVNLGV
jgi:hypothetical protein